MVLFKVVEKQIRGNRVLLKTCFSYGTFLVNKV